MTIPAFRTFTKIRQTKNQDDKNSPVTRAALCSGAIPAPRRHHSHRATARPPNADQNVAFSRSSFDQLSTISPPSVLPGRAVCLEAAHPLLPCARRCRPLVGILGRRGNWLHALHPFPKDSRQEARAVADHPRFHLAARTRSLVADHLHHAIPFA